MGTEKVLNTAAERPISTGMNRRFFERTLVRANGELFWATKGRFGKLTSHHTFFHTQNVSLDGARLVLSPDVVIPDGSVVRVKFGLETCAVEVRTTERVADNIIVRVIFLNPSQKFVSTIEQWIPVDETKRSFSEFWTGTD